MCKYSEKDIRKTLQEANDYLRPVCLFCNPQNFEILKKELTNTIFEVFSNPVIEKNKIYIINKADLYLTFPFEDSNIPRIDLSVLDQFLNKGGEK